MERIDHPIPPLYDGSSRILILGSFPSVKSREAMFFYGHPQNRFWPVLAAVLGCERPTTIEEKKWLALTHHIALWDTIASCEIEGSSDSSIRGVVPNDLTPILRGADIRQIYCNGGIGVELHQRAVCTTDSFGSTHHHRAVHVTFFDATTWSGFLNTHLDDVTNTGIASMRTAQHFNALYRLRAGVIGNL